MSVSPRSFNHVSHMQSQSSAKGGPTEFKVSLRGGLCGHHTPPVGDSPKQVANTLLSFADVLADVSDQAPVAAKGSPRSIAGWKRQADSGSTTRKVGAPSASPALSWACRWNSLRTS